MSSRRKKKKPSDSSFPSGTRVIFARWQEHAEFYPDGAYMGKKELRKKARRRFVTMYACGIVVDETPTHYFVAVVQGADGDFSGTFQIAKGSIEACAIQEF